MGNLPIIFDIETDGFLEDMTKVHCIAHMEVGGPGAVMANHTKQGIEETLQVLVDAPLLIGHNIMKFDIPSLQKIYSWFVPKGEIRDTLLCSRLMWSDLGDKDFSILRVKPGSIPSKLIGRHSLEAWGYRLGVHKGQFGCGYQDDNPNKWAAWSQEMEDYCKQDVVVTAKLWESIKKKEYSEQSIQLEHDFQRCIMTQEAGGFPFDDEGARKFYAELAGKRSELAKRLQEFFPSIERTETFTPKVNSSKFGYTKGVPFTKRWTETFNPGSGDDIAERLQGRGWTPTKKTEKGKVAVDDAELEILENSTGDEAVKALREWRECNKIIAMLAEGKQAWMKLSKGGSIYGQVITNGAVTGRCTHLKPNLAQVPKEEGYGERCRELFVAPEGYSLVGADAAGLELRALAHYLSRFDGGEYVKTVSTGDVHSSNQRAAGLPTRTNAKTFIYGYLYGAGPWKLGTIVKLTDEEVEELSKNSRLVKYAKKSLTRDEMEVTPRNIATFVKGAILKEQFTKRTAGLQDLISAVQLAVDKRNHLVGLDGRILSVRSKHSALNTLLQSAGALIVKKATILLHQRLSERGYLGEYTHTITSNFFMPRQLQNCMVRMVAHVHDEMQLIVQQGLEEEVGKLAVECIAEAGRQFNFRCPLTGEYKHGKNWHDTH